PCATGSAVFAASPLDSFNRLGRTSKLAGSRLNQLCSRLRHSTASIGSAGRASSPALASISCVRGFATRQLQSARPDEQARRLSPQSAVDPDLGALGGPLPHELRR